MEKVIVGANGAGGEIGHLCVNSKETERCGCGKKGCLEQYASATGIARLAGKYLEHYDEQTLLSSKSISAKTVFDAVKEGDKAAVEIAEKFGRYLGCALANLAVITDPAVIVIGGGVSKPDRFSSHSLRNLSGRVHFLQIRTRSLFLQLLEMMQGYAVRPD